MMGNTKSMPVVQAEGRVNGWASTAKEMERIVSANNIEEANSKIKEHLQQSKPIRFNVCIVGESGVGISSFINNIDNRFEAKVGANSTTKAATSYTHPDMANLVFWDLPGFGYNINQTMKDYIQGIQMQRFDLILFLYKARFKRSDGELCREIKRIRKPFFIVRVCFDIDMGNIKNEDEDRIEEVKDEIRSELIENDLPPDKYPCYFVSNRSRGYDYELLTQDLYDAVEDSAKQDAILFHINNTDAKVLNLKKQQIEKRILLRVAVAAAVYSVIPTSDIVANTGVLLILSYETFSMATNLRVTAHANESSNLEILKRCAGCLTSSRLTGILKTYIALGLMFGGSMLKSLFPGYGPIVPPTVFAVTFYTLKSFLDKFIQTAEAKLKMKRQGML